MSNTFNVLRGRQANTLIATAFNADGSVKSDLEHDTAGISIFVQRIGQADGSPLTLSAKATPQTAHADGAFLNLGGGDISVDVPDAPFQSFDGLIRIYGTFTGGVIVGNWYQVVGYNAAAVAVGANTTTPPTPNQIMGGLVTGSQPAGSLARFIRDIKQADVLFEGQIITATSDTAQLNGDATTVCVGQLITIGEEGDIERQSRFITAFDPSTKIVTLDQPWCVVPDDGANYQIKTQRNALIGRLTGAMANTFGGLLANLATMIEDVSGWRWTAKALEEGPAGGGGGACDLTEVESSLTAIKAKTDLITSQTANQQQTPARTIRIIRGDSYTGADAIAIPIDEDFTDWTATFTIRHRVTDEVIAQSTTVSVGATQVLVSLTTAQTAFTLLTTEQDFGPHPYDIQLVSGQMQKTRTGVAVVRRDRTRE